MEALVIGIYRHRNAVTLRALLEPARQAGWRIALWALDDCSPWLSEWTAGAGPGGKFVLLNELLHRHPLAPGEHLVVVDDDIVFRTGDLTRFCKSMAAASLNLAQPAHSPDSHSSYRVNRLRRAARAHLTTFVEIGPVFAISPDWCPRLVPFPPEIGMGFGLELVWADRVVEGCRLGVVDEATVYHADRPTAGYSLAAEERRMSALLRERGIRDISEVQHILATWWKWQVHPPWARAVAGAG